MKKHIAIGLMFGLLLGASSGPASAVNFIKIVIDKPAADSPNGEHGAVIDIDKNGGGNGGPADPGLIDKSHGKDGFEITPEMVDAIGDVGPGPAEPALPGGILEVDDTPPIVILDDGVGSNGGPGNPGVGPGGDIPPGAVVIRLACAFSPDGLVIRNVGDVDAPMGLRLKWQARGSKLAGTVQLDRTLRIGHAASLAGVTAFGADCGIKLVS